MNSVFVFPFLSLSPSALFNQLPACPLPALSCLSAHADLKNQFLSLPLLQHHKLKTKHMARDRVLSSVFHCFLLILSCWFWILSFKVPRAHFLGMEQNVVVVFFLISPLSRILLSVWDAPNSVAQDLIGSSWEGKGTHQRGCPLWLLKKNMCSLWVTTAHPLFS